MSNQPVKSIKKKGKNLLDRLHDKYKVELGMELQGKFNKFYLEGTDKNKILISTNGEFVASAKNVNEAIKAIALYENTSENYYKTKKIVTTYVAEEEVIETKMYEEKMPKKTTSTTGVKMHGKEFYIVKKKPNGTSSGEIFCLYNFKTRNLLWAHWDRDILLGWLASRYKEIEHKDI